MEAKTRKGPWLASLFLVTLTWSLYRQVLLQWWMFDDLFHIRFLREHSALALLFSPAAWGDFPFKMFTPAQLLSYDADLAAFGMRPELFYGHQLLAVAVAAIAFFVALRLWLSRAPALLAAALFLLGAPTVVWVQQLTLRHYTEGLLWSSLAVWSFTRSAREDRPWLAAVSAVLYLAAMLTKEVYVPLVGLLLFLPEGTLRDRVRRARPHLLALAVYLGWRYAMIGTVLGGYGWTVHHTEWPGLAVGLPGRLLRAFGGPSMVGNGVLVLALGSGVAIALSRSGRATLFLGACLAFIVLPVLPVAKTQVTRFAVLAWLATVTTFAFGCQRLWRGRPKSRAAGVVLAAAAVAAASAANRGAWNAARTASEEMRAEGIGFLAMGDGEFLRHPRIPPAAMTELRRLKESQQGRPSGSGWFSDDLFLCSNSTPIRTLWEWNASTRSLTDVTSTLAATRSGYCAGLREAPLTAEFWRAGNDLFWELGPYPDGKYAFVLGDGEQSFDVARRDGYRDRALGFDLRIRYEAPSGWVTFSPELRVDFQKTPRMRWARGRGDE